MDCVHVRAELLDYQRDRLSRADRAEVRAHLTDCPECARVEGAERALTEALERRLPQHPASIALKRRLAAGWLAEGPAAPGRWRRWRRALAPALAAAVLLAVAAPLYLERERGRGETAGAGLVAEAVNDHLRVLASEHPLEIPSGGMHQVKPWFEGRLDFAPVVPFEGSAEFPLSGGAVGYFFDRKAAVFQFHRRLHAISLLVFRAEGLAWPTRDEVPMGDVGAHRASARGFHVILWRRDGLGYALVSDVDPADLWRLGVKLAGGA